MEIWIRGCRVDGEGGDSSNVAFEGVEFGAGGGVPDYDCCV